MSGDPQPQSSPRAEPQPTANGPRRLVLIRHGESLGNVADREARRQGHSRLDLDARDADVGLSETGERQADAVGAYLAGLTEDERPTAILTSPYRRAATTAERATREAGLGLNLLLDERLRERDLGAFDGLTGSGIRERFPDEADRRKRTGKLYYRPPGGESWCDVALRVRSLLDTVRLEHRDARLWVFSHQAVIMSFRFVLEGLDEDRLLTDDRDAPVANCSLTTYERDDSGHLALVAFGDTTPVDRSPVPVTREAESAGKGSHGTT